jgi:hypothetical protein
MKTKLHLLAALFFASTFLAKAQYNDYNTGNYCNNIDLQSIMTVFNDSRSILDFERNINELNYQEFQFDFNQDNQIDFLRVVENGNSYNRYVVIQAVIDYNRFQDVATIAIQKNRFNNRLNINIVSHLSPNSSYQSEMNYYNNRPIYASFFMPNYRFYVSGFWWRNYPKYYRCEPYKRHRVVVYNHNYYGNANNYRRNHYNENHYKNDNHNENRNNGYSYQNDNKRRDDAQRNFIAVPKYAPQNNENYPARRYNTDISVDKNSTRNSISNKFLSEKPVQNNTQNQSNANTSKIASRRF